MRHLTYRPAHNFKRIAAWLIDVLPIQFSLCVISVAVYNVSPIVDWQAPVDVQMASAKAKAIIQIGTLGIWLFYCIIGELSPWHGTLGKRIMGIKVKSVRSSRLTVKQVLIRNAAKILSWLPLCIGFVAAFFTHGNRAWHDSLSHTAVAERR
jgi:uncharacterized RDD family membrane protein YckC